MPSSHLILCLPLLLSPSIFPSIGIFSNESVLRIREPKDWSFCFSISPSNEYLGLISFKMDWLDLLAVQGTLKSLLQHHNSKASMYEVFRFFKIKNPSLDKKVDSDLSPSVLASDLWAVKPGAGSLVCFSALQHRREAPALLRAWLWLPYQAASCFTFMPPGSLARRHLHEKSTPPFF